MAEDDPAVVDVGAVVEPPEVPVVRLAKVELDSQASSYPMTRSRVKSSQSVARASEQPQTLEFEESEPQPGPSSGVRSSVPPPVRTAGLTYSALVEDSSSDEEVIISSDEDEPQPPTVESSPSIAESSLGIKVGNACSLPALINKEGELEPIRELLQPGIRYKAQLSFKITGGSLLQMLPRHISEASLSGEVEFVVEEADESAVSPPEPLQGACPDLGESGGRPNDGYRRGSSRRKGRPRKLTPKDPDYAPSSSDSG